MRWRSGASKLLPWWLSLTLACGAASLPPEEEPLGEQALGPVQEASGGSGGLGDPYRVEDLVPGRLSSGPYELTDVGGVLLFAARDAEHGAELWVTDGTPEGTRLLQEFAPGVASSVPEPRASTGRSVFILATEPATGEEWWVVPTWTVDD